MLHPIFWAAPILRELSAPGTELVPSEFCFTSRTPGRSPKFWPSEIHGGKTVILNDGFRWCSGWWLKHPSEKYDFVSWDYETLYIWKNKKNAPNHQPVFNCSMFRPSSKMASSKNDGKKHVIQGSKRGQCPMFTLTSDVILAAFFSIISPVGWIPRLLKTHNPCPTFRQPWFSAST